MAIESSEGEEERRSVLTVDDDLIELGKKVLWSVSSCKAGNGISSLRDENLETYWQSDGWQPYLVNVQFQKKVKFQKMKGMDLVKPTGWVCSSPSGNDPRETFINTFMLQLAVLSNHLNGRDTHTRQIKVYGPRPNPIPHSVYFKGSHFLLYC